jgi:hypothetical protein
MFIDVYKSDVLIKKEGTYTDLRIHIRIIDISNALQYNILLVYNVQIVFIVNRVSFI